MSGTKGFDWPALMRVAFQCLGLKPSELWSLTPSEFLTLLGPETGAAPLRRDAFEALLARFPDMKDEDPDDRDG
ncbi:phage tail assembly chaperone [Rhodobacterales bacterium HKCCE4037]|nr:phage tail assembly chaperone [Rhodobacterales bacterium HKCCE4037]